MYEMKTIYNYRDSNMRALNQHPSVDGCGSNKTDKIRSCPKGRFESQFSRFYPKRNEKVMIVERWKY